MWKLWQKPLQRRRARSSLPISSVFEPTDVRLDVTKADRRTTFKSSRRRLLIFLVLLVSFIFIYTTLGGFVGVLRWCIAFGNNIVQGSFSRSVRYILGTSAESQQRANDYYEEQRQIIATTAKSFQLHWYFAQIAPSITAIDIDWYTMVGKRTKTMARLLKLQGRDDFRIEKDKCQMNAFFQRNSLPMVPVIRVWRQPRKFLDDLGAVAASATRSKILRWPLFIKFCHLTQGSAEGTRPIPSEDWLEARRGEVDEWVLEKWMYRPDDWERPWREDGNLLTDSLDRGIFMQSATELTFNPNTGENQVIEFKVEVLWGRAILGVSKDLTGWRTALAMRTDGYGGPAAIEVYQSGWDELLFRGRLLGSTDWWHWILEDEYLDCVWDLAERASHVMGIDEVRIDIFISRDNPGGCLINENSLTSGMWYGPHFRNLAKLWAEPHMHKRYKVYNNPIPVYNQTVADISLRTFEREAVNE